MDALIHLEDKIRTTGAALGRLEAELPRYPASRSLLSNILSLKKLHENLRAEYVSMAQFGLQHVASISNSLQQVADSLKQPGK